MTANAHQLLQVLRNKMCKRALAHKRGDRVDVVDLLKALFATGSPQGCPDICPLNTEVFAQAINGGLVQRGRFQVSVIMDRDVIYIFHHVSLI